MKLIKNATKQKLRGGFYTPEPIADFILKWAFSNSKPNVDILEPSCGDGVFFDEIKTNKFKYKSITGVELDKAEAKKSELINLKNKTIVNQDFHKFCNSTDKRFDIIIGNPPYIRYQYFDKPQQLEAAKIFDRAKLKYSKLTNAWVAFVVGSSQLLKEKGKLGFVLPAEILQVSYAETVREYISQFYTNVTIISFKKLVFPEIQQDVVLLLCEKDGTNKHSIRHIEVKDVTELNSVNFKYQSDLKTINFASNKWTFYFLNQKEIDFLERIAKKNLFRTIGDFADVEVGITTGSNSFFTVPLSLVKKYSLEDFAKPLVGRSVQVSSLTFTKGDWYKNREDEARTFLLTFPPIEQLKHHKGALKYLALGKNLGIHEGYKTSIRNEWQMIPSVWIPDAFFVRRNHRYPKLVINQAKAVSTDTMHRVTLKNKVDIGSFAVSFYNSLSLAFSEISGRSYGGGVLELMPSEVEQIVLPYHKVNENLLTKIDTMMRSNTPIAKILELTNHEILHKGFGLSKNDILLADNIWRKLSERRLARNRS